MGLSAPRKERRAKISHDPNNTAWSRSTENFGQKLLLSQGWTPGSTLGTGSTSHAKDPASNVRVNIRDNNLGLGAKNDSCYEGPTTGLDGLQNILGRLNGKKQKLLENEQQAREYSGKPVYAERRWRFGNFVSGGFLVGDRIQSLDNGDCKVRAPASDTRDVGVDAEFTSQMSRRKKTRSGREEEANILRGPSDQALKANLNAMPFDHSSANQDGMQQVNCSKTTEDDALEARQHLQRIERKVQRKRRREGRLSMKDSQQQEQKILDTLPTLAEQGKHVTVVESQPARIDQWHGRHAVRQRFIQHKKMSLTDQKALNEILMIRA